MDMDETGDGGEGGSPPEFMEMNQSKSMAGIISRIRVENFMCHSSLEMEFSECVNFITGQNGSGKSAILTALCVAFGIKAKGTQRASSLKDFIKNGCSYALVVVEMRNEGEDAFKPEIYGNKIIIERRINESSSTTTLKDQYGKKVSQKRDDLHELVEYLNIDVENPCVIMTQDKSREFLHSGNDKEKFKFFFRATLLQQVNDLLRNIQDQLEASKAVIDELEESIRPAIKELENLREKIKGMEYLEEMAQEIEPLRKKLAWSYVYEIDKQIEQHRAKLEKLESRIPSCQQRIDKHEAKIQELEAIRQERRVAISQLMGKTEEIRRSQDQLQQNLTQASKEKVELEEELTRRKGVIESLNKRIHYLQQQITDIQEQHVETSQAEQQKMQERFRSLEEEIDAANLVLQRLQQEEKALEARVQSVNQSSRDLNSELEDSRTKLRDIKRHIDILRRQQTNKVTAFGGERVLSLLQMIERRRRKFYKPPIGPIGAHVSLVNQDWALAIEHAIGKLLNSFIVTNHKDALELRACARESSYPNLQILIYDFDKPLLDMPERMLPDRSLQTVMSAIKSDNTTIVNVLIDQGNMERQVLVENYDIGRKIAFESHSPNVKEVFTKEGMKMFSRGYVQTTLPPDRRIRGGRLCAAIEEKIAEYEDEALKLSHIIQTQEKQKQNVDMELRGLKDKWNSTKRHLLELERNVVSKNTNLRNLKSSADLDSTTDFGPNVDELEHEISRIESEIQSKEDSIEKLRIRLGKAQQNANDCKAAFDGLCGSAKDDIAAFKDAEQELINIEDAISNSVSEKKHYEGLMNTKVLPEVETAKRIDIELQTQREENYNKALIICPVAEVEALGGCQKNTPAQLSAQIRRLEERLKAENQRYPESIDDLRRKYEKQENKISKKKRSYDFFRLKLNTCQEALERRRGKLRRNAQLLRRQLTWQFNGHLNKKGISGHIKVNFSEERLSVEVKMPQDNSTSAVRDTRGLSGGERSFSTLCFALALHEMTEAPFRAMDEFDVFMDAVSRKISLDTVVDFAIAQGSQWIFITPHDIGMVKSNPKVRKQQMPAPRP